MDTIWKYEINPSDEITVLEIPYPAKILDIQVQNDQAMAWFIVNPVREKCTRTIVRILTGSEIQCNVIFSQHIATIQYFGGSFVCHYFLQG